MSSDTDQKSSSAQHERIMMARERLAQSVEELVERDGLTYQKLVELSGISRQQIWNIRKAKFSATVDMLVKLADVFDVEPFELIQ